jgi:predicted esterase
MQSRILVLHGFRQTAKDMQSSILPLVKYMSPSVSFVCVSAPHHVAQQKSDARRWWRTTPTTAKTIQSYDTLSKSLEFIKHEAEKHGPIHGVLGFSQGAIMTSCLLASGGLSDLRFAILVSGILPTDTGIRTKMEGNARSSIPTLHVSGEKDSGICPSESVLQYKHPFFKSNAKWWSHSGGHEIPSTPEFAHVLNSFVDSCSHKKY